MFDVLINNQSLFDNFNLRIKSFEITPPQPKLSIIPIAGTSEIIDLTEAISGDVEYEQRGINIEADIQSYSYFGVYSQLSNLIHGQKCEIIFTRDPGFYWIGRVTVVNDDKINNFGHDLTITVLVDPYKYERHSSLDPWPWDDLSFVDGIVREYSNLPVPSNLTIEGRRKRVQPIFHCSQDMTVTYLGNTFQLYQGINQLWDIRLGLGNHTLSFGGSGTVSVEYRGGSL